MTQILKWKTKIEEARDPPNYISLFFFLSLSLSLSLSISLFCYFELWHAHTLPDQHTFSNHLFLSLSISLSLNLSLSLCQYVASLFLKHS